MYSVCTCYLGHGEEEKLISCGLDTSGRDGALLKVEPYIGVLFEPALSMCCVHIGHKELT